MKTGTAIRMSVAAVATTAAIGFGAGQAHATVTSISLAGNQGLEGVGAFTGFLSYEVTAADAAVLTIGLNNTAPDPTKAQYITAFAFNVDLANLGSLTTSEFQLTAGTFQNNNFQFMNGVSVPAFGDFDYGVALHSNFLAGGSPNGGIHQTAGLVEFQFNVTGTLASSLTATSFMSKLTSNQNDNDALFLVRFRGGDGQDDSDQVPGTIAPLPAAAWGGLALFGALGIGQRLRKRRMSQTI